MKIQFRLIFAFILSTLAASVWATGVSLVYPKTYDKRTSYYDSLAQQLRADIPDPVNFVEQGQADRQGRTVYLGGTELYFEGFQSGEVDAKMQLSQLKTLLPSLNKVKAFNRKGHDNGIEQQKALAESFGFGFSSRMLKDTDSVFATALPLVQGESSGATAFWLPRHVVSSDPTSAFQRFLMELWRQQLVIIAGCAPFNERDFVFVALKRNREFAQRLSALVKQNQKQLFVMLPPEKAQTLAVVYPRVKAPHNAVFNQIIDGIRKQFDGDVNLLEISEDNSKASLAAEIDKDRPDLVITLSSAGKDVAEMLKSKVPWVAGAVQLSPDDVSGISPEGAPNLILSYLHELAPDITRVQVVYSDRSRWLIELAKQAATKLGLTLIAHPVNSRKEAVLKYTELFKQSDYRTDAFWLPYDRVTADGRYVLPLVLDASWDKRFVVVSSVPPHAKRGALLSLYPDNETTGVNLVKMVETMFVRSNRAGVVPTSEVLLAVNLRTASHLGFEYTTKQKGQFHLTFPSR